VGVGPVFLRLVARPVKQDGSGPGPATGAFDALEGLGLGRGTGPLVQPNRRASGQDGGAEPPRSTFPFRQTGAGPAARFSE